MQNDIKKEFPLLAKSDLIYLDNASTTQKPQIVLDSILSYYTSSNANIHRGMYPLAQQVDTLWKEAHEKIGKYINAEFGELFFVKNATEGINWIAQTVSEQILKKNDIVVVSNMEHHSNILPWRRLVKEKSIQLEFLKIGKDLIIDINHLKELFEKYGEKIKIVSVTHMSNVLGSINDISEISKIAHKYNSLVAVDGTQSIAHINIDVKNLNCDFFVFSGHKIYGPTGIGCVYAKRDLLERFEPVWQGGEMVDQVSDVIVFKGLPFKFEAGTPNIEGGIALSTAIDWFGSIKDRFEYEKNLATYLYERIKEIKEIEIILDINSPILSFNIKGIHSHDIASDLGEKNICVRAGSHCAQPLFDSLGIKGCVRVSLGIYNTKNDIDFLAFNLKEIIRSYL